MASHINELVKMRDIDSLFELMTEDEARRQLEAVGLQDEMADAILGMAQP